MRSFLSKALELIQRHILADFFLARKAANELLASQEKIESAIDEDSLPSVLTETDAINRYAEQEQMRRKSVEEKARGNLLAVTVCSSLVFAGLSFMTSQGAAPIFLKSVFWPVMFMLPVTYFVMAAISAVKALEISKSYGVTIENERLEPDRLKELMLRCLKLNQVGTNIKANWTSVSFLCLRNAVICLFLFTSLAGFRLVFLRASDENRSFIFQPIILPPTQNQLTQTPSPPEQKNSTDNPSHVHSCPAFNAEKTGPEHKKEKLRRCISRCTCKR